MNDWQSAHYTPSGHVGLREAIIRATQAFRPHLDVLGLSDPARSDSGEGRDPFSHPPANTWDEDAQAVFKNLEFMRSRFRWYLAEGHASAVGQLPDGELELIKPAYWRTTQGSVTLQFPDDCSPYTSVFLQEEKELGKILADMPHWFSTDSKRVVVAEQAEDLAGSLDHANRARTRNELKRWLIDFIRPLSKGDMRKGLVYAHAKTALAKDLSERMFNNVWREALEATGRADLAKGGRPKSLHQNH